MPTDKYKGLRDPYGEEQKILANIAHHSGIPLHAFPLGMSSFRTGYGSNEMIEGRTNINAPDVVVYSALPVIGASK